MFIRYWNKYMSALVLENSECIQKASIWSTWELTTASWGTFFPGPQQNYKQPELPSSRDRTPHVRAPVMSCYLQQIRWTEEHEKKWCRSSPEAHARFPRARRDSRASVRWRRSDALMGETQRSMKQVKRSTASQWRTARAPANTHTRPINKW